MKYLLPILLFSCLFMGGCTQADVDRAQAALDQATATLAKVEAARDAAAAALAETKTIASTIGGARADALIAKAETGLDMANDGVKVARSIADTAASGLDAAKKSQAVGGATVDTIIAVGLALITGGATITATVVPIIQKYRSALTMTAAHADRMEAAITPEQIEAAKKISIAEQVAGGVKSLIEKART